MKNYDESLHTKLINIQPAISPYLINIEIELQLSPILPATREQIDRFLQWRSDEITIATKEQKTAATTGEETAAAADVGLGAGGSVAVATPATARATMRYA